MDEISVLLAQSGLCREKLLARVLAQMQSINADVQIHLRSATINFPSDAEAEPMTPPTKDMGLDPISLNTSTTNIAETLPKITPVTIGCASATSTQVIRKMNEYQSHPPFSYRRIL